MRWLCARLRKIDRPPKPSRRIVRGRAHLLFIFLAWVVLVHTVTNHPSGFLPGHHLSGHHGLRNELGQMMTMGRRVAKVVAVAMAGAAFGADFSSGAIRIGSAGECGRLPDPWRRAGDRRPLDGGLCVDCPRRLRPNSSRCVALALLPT